MKRSIKLVDYIKYVDADTKGKIEDVVDITDESLEIKRASGSDIETSDDDVYISEGYASTRLIDFSGDIVIPKGIDLSVFKENPIIFYNHFQSALPIGKAIEVKKDSYGLKIKIKYAVEENSEADTIYKLVRGGYIKQHSIGFLPIEYFRKGTNEFKVLNKKLKTEYPEYKGDAERIITKSLLLEVSIVNIADNQSSTIMNVKGINEEDIKTLNKFGANINYESIKEVDVGSEDITDNKGQEDITEVEVVTPIQLELHSFEPKKSIVLIESPKEKKEISKEIKYIKMIGKDKTEKHIDIKVLRAATKSGKLFRI